VFENIINKISLIYNPVTIFDLTPSLISIVDRFRQECEDGKKYMLTTKNIFACDTYALHFKFDTDPVFYYVGRDQYENFIRRKYAFKNFTNIKKLFKLNQLYYQNMKEITLTKISLITYQPTGGGSETNVYPINDINIINSYSYLFIGNNWLEHMAMSTSAKLNKTKSNVKLVEFINGIYKRTKHDLVGYSSKTFLIFIDIIKIIKENIEKHNNKCLILATKNKLYSFTESYNCKGVLDFYALRPIHGDINKILTYQDEFNKKYAGNYTNVYGSFTNDEINTKLLANYDLIILDITMPRTVCVKNGILFDSFLLIYKNTESVLKKLNNGGCYIVSFNIVYPTSIFNNYISLLEKSFEIINIKKGNFYITIFCFNYIKHYQDNTEIKYCTQTV
jgi:hypothetical protein